MDRPHLPPFRVLSHQVGRITTSRGRPRADDGSIAVRRGRRGHVPENRNTGNPTAREIRLSHAAIRRGSDTGLTEMTGTPSPMGHGASLSRLFMTDFDVKGVRGWCATNAVCR
jgi:hypothetical protein